jgi:hypothetical protein
MARITLDTFSEQRSSVPGDSLKHPNYLIQGAYPYYTRNQLGVLEVQPAPLAASPTLVQVGGTLDGNVVSLLASIDPNVFGFAITDTTRVYKINTNSTLTDFGYPYGSSSANAGGQLAIYNNNILAVNSSSGVLERTIVAGGDVWHSFGSIQSAAGIHYMTPFLDYCALVDGDATFGFGHLIRKITSAWTLTIGIDLGANWGVIGRLMNYNNKYLVIPGAYRGGGSVGSTYLFIWDGISAAYSYVVAVPGRYIDGKTINGIPYIIAANSNSSYSIYKMTGIQLKWVADFNYNSVTASAPVCGFDSGIAVLTSSGVLVVEDDAKHPSQYFLDSATYGFNSAGDSMGSDNTFFVGTGTKIYSFSRTGNPYSNITYKSHFLRGEKTTGQINWVRVYYDTAPINTGDKISTTLKVVDENGVTGGLANGTYALNDIIPGATDSPKYTQLDGKGVSFDQVQVNLTTTTAGGSTWFPLIRSVVIDYDPL